jgi:delta8-fatty-acid desaturase
MTLDSVAKFVLKFQHRLYYVVMSLARFNLYANSYVFLWKRGIVQGNRGWPWWSEIFGIVVFWGWYIYVVRGCGGWKTQLGYFLITNIVPSPLHVQVSANLYQAIT